MSSTEHVVASPVPDKCTIQAFARGSTEAGFHVGGVGPPGRTGSPWLGSSGYDFVAQFTGTYSMYPEPHPVILER